MLQTSPKISGEAIAALGRADAMGLLPANEPIDTRDLPAALLSMLDHLHRAGIGRTIHALANARLAESPDEMEHLLRQLNAALEESPVPEFEWKQVGRVLGPELLARLVGISAISLRRYEAAARSTPDKVAARLHFLAMVTGDLAGAYNDMGVRQWFDRKRTQLGGRTPAELLKGDWTPDREGPSEVRELARALTASFAA
jgi:hypothetical protein